MSLQLRLAGLDEKRKKFCAEIFVIPNAEEIIS